MRLPRCLPPGNSVTRSLDIGMPMSFHSFSLLHPQALTPWRSSSTLLLNPTQNRLQDHSFNFNNETTTLHCSLFMLTNPSDEAGPPSRWCCAELASRPPLVLQFNDKTATAHNSACTHTPKQPSQDYPRPKAHLRDCAC